MLNKTEYNHCIETYMRKNNFEIYNKDYLLIACNIIVYNDTKYLLDICNNNITFTFFGKDKSFEKIHNNLIKKYFEIGTFIYKDSEESFILICKNQTCSEKLKSIDQVEEYVHEKSI